MWSLAVVKRRVPNLTIEDVPVVDTVELTVQDVPDPLTSIPLPPLNQLGVAEVDSVMTWDSVLGRDPTKLTELGLAVTPGGGQT